MRTLLPMVLLATACADQPLWLDSLQRQPERPRVVRLLDLDALSSDDGMRVSSETPFQSLELMIGGLDAPAVLEVRLPNGAWIAPDRLEALDAHANAHLSLGAPTTEVWVRSSEPVAWAQVNLHTDAHPVWDDDPRGTPLREGRAHAGEWTLPADVWSAGQTMYLPYESATSCYGTLRSGSALLGDWLVQHFGGNSFQGYNCRYIGGTTTLSVHSTGRAIDVFVPMDGTGSSAADNDLGDPIGNYLVENAEEIGISLIIWDQASWGAHRSGDKHQSYGGVHPHNDHLHIELTTDGAEERSPWFTSGAWAHPPESIFTGDHYLVGDWDGDGVDNLAVRRGNEILMDFDFDGSHDLRQVYGRGDDEDAYLVGDWDGDGRDNLAVRRGNDVLMDFDFDGSHDLLQTYGAGEDEDAYLVGDWDGDGLDNLAVRRDRLVLMDTDFDGSHDLEQSYGRGNE